MVRTYAHDGEAASRLPTGESAVSAYLQKVSRLRAAEQSLHAATPGSTEYKSASTRYERLTRELMDDFARAVRSVR